MTGLLEEANLIDAIRGCPTCRPKDYVVCRPHAQELERVSGPPCTDRECGACRALTIVEVGSDGA